MRLSQSVSLAGLTRRPPLRLRPPLSIRALACLCFFLPLAPLSANVTAIGYLHADWEAIPPELIASMTSPPPTPPPLPPPWTLDYYACVFARERAEQQAALESNRTNASLTAYGGAASETKYADGQQGPGGCQTTGRPTHSGPHGCARPCQAVPATLSRAAAT